ncbi:MAG: VIT1/CCC1 transporter family protein [Herpetosiphonaceae bacterium]|nr:VIT1/CCC1 transporter family protein [Herpetosiphonaceae bacterium]
MAQRVATERFEIIHEPAEERAELQTIYAAKGLEGPLLEAVVAQLTADRERWLRAMVHDELGVVDAAPIRPWRQGLLVGGAFMVGGLIPTVPFLLHLPLTRLWAYGLTAVTALVLGSLKSRYTEKGPLQAGLEFLGIVTGGTIAGILLGALLHAL